MSNIFTVNLGATCLPVTKKFYGSFFFLIIKSSKIPTRLQMMFCPVLKISLETHRYWERQRIQNTQILTTYSYKRVHACATWPEIQIILHFKYFLSSRLDNECIVFCHSSLVEATRNELNLSNIDRIFKKIIAIYLITKVLCKSLWIYQTLIRPRE